MFHMIKKRALQKFDGHFYIFQNNFASLRGPKWVLFRLKRFFLEPLPITMLMVAGRRLSTSVPPAIPFLFLHFICFIVENVFSNIYISKHIFIAKYFNLGNLSFLTNFQRLSTVYSNAVDIVHFY